ncbi:MAG: hypothetical protein AABY22_09925 [Nanoarchaeota archaeon]
MKMNKFITIIKKWGDSKAIIIPKNVLLYLNINKGVEVEVIINKINKTISIQCNKCKDIFTSPKKDVYDCPHCDNTFLSHEDGLLLQLKGGYEYDK